MHLWNRLLHFSALVVFALPIVVPSTIAADRTEGHAFATRSVSYAKHGMVAASHPLAVEAGLRILRQGGNAVDAAIGVNAALAFLEPVACGLGGDLFVLGWDVGERKYYGLNASGIAPAALDRTMIPATDAGTIPLHSPYSWTVPGVVDGWFALHERYGRLPMQKILAPAIALAREGAPVPQVIAAAWQRSTRIFADKPGFAEVFMPEGRAPREGEIFRNPHLARTLEGLASSGREAFYEGEIAKEIVAYSKSVNGFLSMEDLASQSSEWVEPMGTTYRGYEVLELPPNGQGLAALQMLNILEAYDLRALGRNSVDFWHLLIEAKKLAFADRARFYADPRMSEIPLARLASKDYARQRRALIDMQRAARTVEPGNPGLERGDTTYLAVADSEGRLVSLIQSNYTGFGSGYVIPSLGFGLQNRGALFSLQEGHPNELKPGKRPFHTIIPAFLTREGKPWCAFGVMGGATQPQAHAQVVINLVDFDMNIQEAGDAPRFVHSGSSQPTGTIMNDGGAVHFESGVPMEVLRDLQRRGHRLESRVGIFGGYQIVCRDPSTGVLSGATESRKDGLALGY